MEEGRVELFTSVVHEGEGQGMRRPAQRLRIGRDCDNSETVPATEIQTGYTKIQPCPL